MVQEAAQRLLVFLLDRIDDGLRTINVIDHGSVEVIYLREDLKAIYDAENYREVTSLFQELPAIEDRRLLGKPIGQREAVIHHHENAFVLQLPYEEDTSIIASVEPDVGRGLHGFIDELRRVTRDDGTSP